jgi:hypothetical protein
MAGVPRPDGCYLEEMERCGAPAGRMRWRNSKGDRLYEWDSQHGHIEAYDKRGRHVGALDAISEEKIGEAVRGRTVDV